jgi:hypothetical protein
VQPVAEDGAEAVNLRLRQSGLGESDRQLAQKPSHGYDRRRAREPQRIRHIEAQNVDDARAVGTVLVPDAGRHPDRTVA